jgi:hypothetical protein
MWELALIPWVIITFLGVIIAEQKNRSWIEGLLWGGLLSVVGLIILAVMPSAPAPPPAGTQAVQCPRCNAIQNVPRTDDEYECWQCHQRNPLNRRVRPA